MDDVTAPAAVRVKICGLTQPRDAEAAIAAGADALGFVLEPSSPRCVPPEARDWIRGLVAPWPVRIGVFGPWRPEVWTPEGFDGIQSLDAVPASAGGRFRLRTLALPPAGEDVDVEGWRRRIQALMADPLSADAVLLDAHRAGAYGGTGLRVDAGLARTLVGAAAPRRVVLAGGLNPDNVAEAVRSVRPWAVDVSSGIEASPGVKDLGALRAFIQAARGA